MLTEERYTHCHHCGKSVTNDDLRIEILARPAFAADDDPADIESGALCIPCYKGFKKLWEINKAALCEWCNERPGEYDMSPPGVEYATMICQRCFEEEYKDLYLSE